MRFVCIDGKEFSKKKDALDWENKILEQEKSEIKRISELKKESDPPLGDGRRSDAGTTRSRYRIKLPKRYHSYLLRANAKGLKFELSVDEFNSITSLPCKYCGSGSVVGIDRVDSSDGYTVDNSVPCCAACNMMKYTHSVEFFMSHIKKIYNHCLD